MRKFLLFLSLLLPLMVMADRKPKTIAPEVKKVAILETVDKTGQVSYAHKLMLRTSLAKAITEAEGYEGYDRTDLDALLGEQTFQRTGMVTSDQIKRVGELTGAQYVLVAEAVMVDSATIFASAKIIDVETAQTIKAETQLMSATPQDIQVGCTSLAGNLLGISLKAAITQAANTPSAAQKPAAPAATTPAEATPQPAPKPKSKALVTWEWPADCSVTVNRCYVANGRLYIDLRFTNNAGEDFKYYMAASYIKVYDSDGGCIEGSSSQKNTILWVKGKQLAVDNSYIPSEVTIPVVYAVNNFTSKSNLISLCEIIISHGTVYGMYRNYKLRIKNLPIER